MSVFVWLGFSERERRKMLDVVDAFREHDTRDDLVSVRCVTPSLTRFFPARANHDRARTSARTLAYQRLKDCASDQQR